MYKFKNNAFVESYISNTQDLITKATFLILQASSQAQLAKSLHVSLVDETYALLHEMQLAIQNINITLPLDHYQLEENFFRPIVQIIEISKSTELVEVSLQQSELEAKAALLQANVQIKMLMLIQIISSPIFYSLRTQIENMEFLVANVLEKTNSLILKTRLIKNVLVNAAKLQNVSLQAALKVELLSLCYPNPCLHGGMCTANSKN